MAASDWPDFGFHHHSVPEPPLFQAGPPMDAESLAGWMPEIVGIRSTSKSRKGNFVDGSMSIPEQDQRRVEELSLESTGSCVRA